MRIDFQFDNAAFHFRFLPFTIPYPVPFRLLGDETKVSLPHPSDWYVLSEAGAVRSD